MAVSPEGIREALLRLFCIAERGWEEGWELPLLQGGGGEVRKKLLKLKGCVSS